MRIQVNVSDLMLEKIDKYAKLMGVTRSGFCCQLIGQGILNLEKTYEFIDKLSSLDFDTSNGLNYDLLYKHMKSKVDDFEKELEDNKKD